MVVLICISLIMSEKRSYPTSVVRGSSREYQAVTVQEQPRGVTPHQRSGGTAERSYPASEIRGGGQEGIPHAPKPKAKGGSQEEIPHAPKPKVRGGGQEAQPHTMAARAQEGLEELYHVEGQEGQW